MVLVNGFYMSVYYSSRNGLTLIVFFFSSRRRHTRCREVSWARRCVQETDTDFSTHRPGLLLQSIFDLWSDRQSYSNTSFPIFIPSYNSNKTLCLLNIQKSKPKCVNHQ
eukprot:TRINITY_DN33390_c0_g1_i1.p1 TRINITY_DN33390_c0_g1~~TRINITY_DN33390_c0_g1_i1.p1  ORF type:complete len:109 (+),score=17.61 TRINITY_DN33390_c0_g1_i1:54-380(+)